MEIIEETEVLKYLKSRQLEVKYRKAKNHLINNNLKVVDFKKRKPKSDEIYQFRIDKKYRAFSYFKDDKLRVFKVSDHQN